MMENWCVVQRNKETGEEKLFLYKEDGHISKDLALIGAQIRKEIVSDKYEVFVRRVK